MGFVSRDLTVKLFAGSNCTPTPPACTPTPPACTPTPPDPDCTPTPPDCLPTICQSCTNTPDCTPTPCNCTNSSPDCTPTPGGGERRTQGLGALRQQLREALAQHP